MDNKWLNRFNCLITKNVGNIQFDLYWVYYFQSMFSSCNHHFAHSFTFHFAVCSLGDLIIPFYFCWLCQWFLSIALNRSKPFESFESFLYFACSLRYFFLSYYMILYCEQPRSLHPIIIHNWQKRITQSEYSQLKYNTFVVWKFAFKSK